MDSTETDDYISTGGYGNITDKQKQILKILDEYHYMTRSQICRKIWGGDSRKSRIQFSKHFSKSKITLFLREGRLKVHDGVYSTFARGRGAPHQIATVDVLLDLEAKARELRFGFFFAYDPVSEKLRPDATVVFTDHNKCLLCFIEVHLETQDESILHEKVDKYRELARGERFKETWSQCASRFNLTTPNGYGFKVLIVSKKERKFPHPRFVSLTLGQEIPGGLF